MLQECVCLSVCVCVCQWESVGNMLCNLLSGGEESHRSEKDRRRGDGGKMISFLIKFSEVKSINQHICIPKGAK